MRIVVQGITAEWYASPPILIYTVTEISSAKLDTWSKDVVEQVELWAEQHTDPCCILYDLSSSGVSMPYLVLTKQQIYQVGIIESGSAAIEKLLERYPHLRIRFVVLISKNTSGAVTRKHGVSANYEERCNYHVFFQRDAALEWLAGS
jgi:hypothetical protein